MEIHAFSDVSAKSGNYIVPGEPTVTIGIGHGKQAARYIEAFLNGASYELPERHEIKTFDKLNNW